MTTNNDIALPSVDESAAIIDGIYSDVFFSKMAEYGFVPNTQEAVLSMLETAAYLDQVDANVKAAESVNDPYVTANYLLKQALSQENLINPASIAEQNNLVVKQASYALAHDPSVYKAVLAIKTANS